MIKYEDFAKLDIKVGTVLEAERVPKTDKLIKLIVDLGREKRQLVAGVGQKYEPEQLVGKQTPVLINLEPVKLRGVESNGMILAATAEGELPILLSPIEKIANGSRVK